MRQDTCRRCSHFLDNQHKGKTMEYPVIDLPVTGRRINQIRKEKRITVQMLQEYFGMKNPQSIYRWFREENLPSLENAFVLSKLFSTSLDEILVQKAF